MKAHPPKPRHFLIGGLVMFAVWAVAPLVAGFFGLKPADNAGTLGDSFGLVNALFQGATLLLVVMGIRYQHYEIELLKAENAAQERARREESERQQLAAWPWFDLVWTETKPGSHCFKLHRRGAPAINIQVETRGMAMTSEVPKDSFGEAEYGPFKIANQAESLTGARLQLSFHTLAGGTSGRVTFTFKKILGDIVEVRRQNDMPWLRDPFPSEPA